MFRALPLRAGRCGCGVKLPRDVDGPQFVRALQRRLDYVVVRQRGSHIRVATQRDGVYEETVPRHFPIGLKSLESLLKNISKHHAMTVEELLDLLDL